MKNIFITVTVWTVVVLILLSCNKTSKEDLKSLAPPSSSVPFAKLIEEEPKPDFSVPLGSFSQTSFSSEKYTVKITKTGEQFRLQTVWKEEHKSKYLKRMLERERLVPEHLRFAEEDLITRFDCSFSSTMLRDHSRIGDCTEDGEQKQKSPYFILFKTTEDSVVTIGINDGGVMPRDAMFNFYGSFKKGIRQ